MPIPRRGDHDYGMRLAALPPVAPDVEYTRRVDQMAEALHVDCLLEWRAIAVVDPGRAVTQHMVDAHYGQAHDLVRRVFPELDSARRIQADKGDKLAEVADPACPDCERTHPWRDHAPLDKLAEDHGGWPS